MKAYCYRNNDTAPLELVPWLFENNAITKKLKFSVDDKVDVKIEILSHEWVHDVLQQYIPIKLVEVQGKFILRKINATARGVLCWQASTIIPFDTYASNQSLFDKLNSDTSQFNLGDLLFGSFGITRVEATVQKIEGNWTRYACYLTLSNHPFYLYEVFQPTFYEILFYDKSTTQ